MSSLVRWIIAIVLALVLLLVVVGIGYFGLLLMAFGADSCVKVGNDASVSLFMAAPALMALGVIVAAILFGLNKLRLKMASLLPKMSPVWICSIRNWLYSPLAIQVWVRQKLVKVSSASAGLSPSLGPVHWS